MTRKKIGIVLARPPGYSETFFRSKISGLQKSGFKVSLYCQENKENFELCPTYTSPRRFENIFLQLGNMFSVYLSLLGSGRKVINFIKLEKAEGTNAPDILKKIYLNAHILKSDVDWLHYGFTTLALKRESLAKAIGAKLAVSFRGFDLDVYPLKNPECYKQLWTKIDKVHSISRYLLEKGRSLGMPGQMSYRIIYPAVDISLFKGYERNYLKNGPLKIVTIARLHWIKGIDLLIDAAKRLKEQNFKFEWTIIGGGEQKEEERYRYHITEAGLVDVVKLIGKLTHTETLRFLKESDLYVQTSWSEGFCNAILEAQAIGVPPVAFNVGGISENIDDGKTGWLVKNVSSEGMASKILEVANLPVAELREVSIAAKDRINVKFNIEKQQVEYREFYS